MSLGVVQPVLLRALANKVGRRLEPIKLVELALHRHVGDEVEGVAALALLLLGEDEGLLAGVGVVHRADLLDVGERHASALAVEHLGELVELLEGRADVDLGAVEEDLDDGLGRTRIRDNLLREVDIGVVVLVIKQLLVLFLPLEEKNEPVNGLHRGEQILVMERVELFDHDVFDPDAVDQGREDPRIRLNRAPFGHC